MWAEKRAQSQDIEMKHVWYDVRLQITFMMTDYHDLYCTLQQVDFQDSKPIFILTRYPNIRVLSIFWLWKWTLKQPELKLWISIQSRTPYLQFMFSCEDDKWQFEQTEWTELHRLRLLLRHAFEFMILILFSRQCAHLEWILPEGCK